MVDNLQHAKRLTTVRRVLWAVAAAGAVIGAISATLMYIGANGYPGATNALCFGMAFSVIPYVLARAISEIISSGQS